MAELVVHFTAKRDEATMYLHLSEASLTRPHPKRVQPRKKTRKAEYIICISQRFSTPEKKNWNIDIFHNTKVHSSLRRRRRSVETATAAIIARMEGTTRSNLAEHFKSPRATLALVTHLTWG